MKVAFKALISFFFYRCQLCQFKQVKIKSLVSGDKEAEMILRFLPTDDILDTINKLHKADDSIMIVLMDEKEE